ncbi:hypothetical protein TSUD_381120 [Trifolium subterraneum]|uniref:HMA domain-containing protein n=1 Tax=Trifolium subterraneum TaxID=3900 RepID=A0A2Z6MGA5_TRISU|nr:hypothetical protein TSUD_381120 [Trifolium subterraneum]
MSKEEILKIQKYVLKVSIHCDGCKQKVKKILKKIDGVFITEIDAEQGMVTVYGIVDPNVVIKRLAKSGKPAEIWSNPKVNNNINQNNIANLMKNMQIDNNTPNNKGQMGPQNNQNQPKGSGGGQHQQGQNPQHQQLQQQQQQQQQLQQHLQQLQQMKGSGDLKVPQFKDTNMSIKMPPNQNPNMKDVNISLPEDDDFDDDEMMDFDDDEYSDDVSDDVMDNPQHPLNKMKLPIGANGPAHMMINGGNLMNAQKGGENGGGNGKKSGGGGLGAVQVHGLGGGSDSKNVEKKGCGGGGNDYGQIQGGDNKNNGGKNEGGMPEGKNGNKNVSGGTSGGGGGAAEIPNNNGDTKVNKMSESSIQDMMNNEFPNIGSQGHHPINMSGMPMGGNMSMMNKMGGNMSAVQGHFAGAVTGSGGSGVVAGGYGGPKMMMGGNPYQQQPYIAAMMNQQRGMPIGERFQPMMYAKPPMATNYMYPPPYNYPPPSQYPQDSYSNFFNDENTSSCNIM